MRSTTKPSACRRRYHDEINDERFRDEGGGREDVKGRGCPCDFRNFCHVPLARHERTRSPKGASREG